MRFFNGPKITELRQKNGLSQKALGVCVGVTKQAVSQYEGGACMPNPNILVRIADTFRVSLDVFFTSNLSDMTDTCPDIQPPQRAAHEPQIATGG